jgi:hypothetical protein
VSQIQECTTRKVEERRRTPSPSGGRPPLTLSPCLAASACARCVPRTGDCCKSALVGLLTKPASAARVTCLTVFTISCSFALFACTTLCLCVGWHGCVRTQLTLVQATEQRRFSLRLRTSTSAMLRSLNATTAVQRRRGASLCEGGKSVLVGKVQQVPEVLAEAHHPKSP